jgi:hypothetical protein
VFGGSNGGDVLRNGEELTDMFNLTMSTMVWARVSLNGGLLLAISFNFSVQLSFPVPCCGVRLCPKGCEPLSLCRKREHEHRYLWWRTPPQRRSKWPLVVFLRFLSRVPRTCETRQHVCLQVFVFDTVNESWRDGAVATTHCPHSTVLLKPFPRCCATAVAHQGSMFVYGGWHNGPLGECVLSSRGVGL